MAEAHDYDDIPGTTVFDAEQSRRGYHLNMFCMALMKADSRAAFKANEAEFLQQFQMTAEQREAVLKRDWNRMIALGGNIYFLSKLFSTDGKSFQFTAAQMTGMSQNAYAQMMLAGGRSPEGNRTQADWQGGKQRG
jgi:protocatechuate 4,5-dioxygenase, alpha chain